MAQGPWFHLRVIACGGGDCTLSTDWNSSEAGLCSKYDRSSWPSGAAREPFLEVAPKRDPEDEDTQTSQGCFLKCQGLRTCCPLCLEHSHALANSFASSETRLQLCFLQETFPDSTSHPLGCPFGSLCSYPYTVTVHVPGWVFLPDCEQSEGRNLLLSPL